MKRFVVILMILASLIVKGQNSVHFEIKSLPPNHASNAAIYIAGSFNGWNPQNEQYRFQKDDQGNYFIDLKLPPATYEFKITRGGWDKVECKAGGAGMGNRILKVGSNENVELDIEEWQDRYPSRPRVSTASKNVHIIDTAFWIPQLKRTRRIWIYLPSNYSASKQHYPVIYMHDGQNIFDDATSFSGEWGVDECIDTMRVKCIVVGIDNSESKRINEYCPYDFSLKSLGLSNADTLNKGEGGLYVDFLVRTLKPFIDKNYRTLSDKNHTFIAGSSMGGSISMYALLKYPKVFGGAGVFSPAFWVGPKIFDDIKANGKKVNARIYFYAGKQESETMVPLTMKAFDAMSKISRSKMTTVIRDEGKHNEATWRKEFPLFYKWIMQIK